MLAQLAAARTELAALLRQKRAADRASAETIERLHASVLEASSAAGGSSGAKTSAAAVAGVEDAAEASAEHGQAAAAGAPAAAVSNAVRGESLAWFRDQIAARDVAAAGLDREVAELRHAVAAAKGDTAAAADRGGRMGGAGKYWLLLPKGVTK